MTNNYFFDSLNFMREWVELGDRTDNPYMKFMAYWVAFNMLYLPKEEQDDRVSERQAIKNFYKKNKEKFGSYNPFNNGDADFFKGRALDCIYRGREEAGKVRQKLNRKDEEALILIIYKIRCNFFHGNKKLNNPDDKDLVINGARIIKGYLGTFGV